MSPLTNKHHTPFTAAQLPLPVLLLLRQLGPMPVSLAVEESLHTAAEPTTNDFGLTRCWRY